MLFKPSWEVQSLEGLITWLETMPADDFYDWHNCRGGCLYGQYAAAHGLAWTDASKFRAAVYSIAYQEPWTFGAALERARKASECKQC